jgi:protein-tyrosine phosphatase
MRADIYEINGPWPGKLAIVPRPRAGDWLEDEVRVSRSAGVDVVVSLLGADEIAELGLAREPEDCHAHHITWIHFPIRDRDVPAAPPALEALAQELEGCLGEGKNVAVHCRVGIGRSSLLCACILVLGGLSPEEAFHRITAARGCAVPDTVEQREWVASFAQNLVVPSGKSAR